MKGKETGRAKACPDSGRLVEDMTCISGGPALAYHTRILHIALAYVSYRKYDTRYLTSTPTLLPSLPARSSAHVIYHLSLFLETLHGFQVESRSAIWWQNQRSIIIACTGQSLR